MFSQKKCNQCKGVGYIIKNPCKECEGKGSKVYTVEEIIPIPRGIKSDTNIRVEKKVKHLLIKDIGKRK
jgi:molecular chaperone DnaJ